jgi:hypothetical protein
MRAVGPVRRRFGTLALLLCVGRGGALCSGCGPWRALARTAVARACCGPGLPGTLGTGTAYRPVQTPMLRPARAGAAGGGLAVARAVAHRTVLHATCRAQADPRVLARLRASVRALEAAAAHEAAAAREAGAAREAAVQGAGAGRARHHGGSGLPAARAPARLRQGRSAGRRGRGRRAGAAGRRGRGPGRGLQGGGVPQAPRARPSSGCGRAGSS